MGSTTFYRMLKSPYYAGFFVEKGVLHKGTHQPMITLEEHRRMKAILGVKERLQPKHHVFPYTGMIYCKHCSAMITAQINTNRYGSVYTYYRCTRCRGHHISENVLQAQIDAEVSRIYVSEQEFMVWAREAVERFWHEDRQTDHAVYNQKLRTLSSVDTQLDNLLGVLTKGLITDEEYKTRKIRKLQNSSATSLKR